MEDGNYKEGFERKGRSTPITETEFVKLLDSKCKKSVNGAALYRGIRRGTGDVYLKLDPSQHTRVSEYTDNWYILLMQLMPEWKNYPDFSKSIITVSGMSRARTWGNNIYRVIPFDGATLGVCPYEHFWGSFKWLDGGGMSDLNERMRKLFDFVENYFAVSLQPKSNETEKAVLKKAFDYFDNNKEKIWAEIQRVGQAGRFRMYDSSDGDIPYFNTDNKLLDAFAVNFRPKGFKLVKAGSKSIADSKEVWTESPCILIHTDIEDKLDDYTAGPPPEQEEIDFYATD
jgi:hypothetical protein